MNVRAITTKQEWNAISDTWDDLLNCSVTANVFLTCEWLRTWWDYYGDNKELLILVVEDKKGVCGIAPLYLIKQAIAPGLYEKVIRFIGDEEVGSDFLEVIIHPRRLVDTVTVIFEYLWKEIEWDRMSLRSVDASSPCHSIMFVKAERMGAVVRRRIQDVCPFMVIPESIAEFNLQADIGFKHAIGRNNLIQIKKAFPDMRFECTSSSSELAERMEQFFDLHEERWKLSGQSGNFYDERKRAFYRKIAQLMLPTGRFCLSCLYLENRIEAINLSLVYDDICYALQGGVSEKGLQYKAGNLLSYCFFENIVGKFKQFEWLCGDELYKYYWGGMNRYTLHIDIAKTFIGRLSCASTILLEGLRTAGRFVLGRKRN